MNLVTWNCAMGLQKKYQELLAVDADVMITQECSHSFITQLGLGSGWSSSWLGANPNKGLGVVVKPPWILRDTQALKPKWAGKLVIDGP
jgi:hypothetical protein